MPATVEVIVGGRITVPASAPAEFRARLFGMLTIPNPDRRKHGARRKGPTVIEIAERPDGVGGSVVVPRGCVAHVRNAAAACRINLVWTSRAVSRSTKRVPAADLGVTLRDYQVVGLDALLNRVQAVAVAPPGSGKTTVGAAALVVSGEPGIVLAPTIEIVEQWIERLSVVGVSRVRRVGKGARAWAPLEPGEVAVGLPQSFDPLRDGELIASAGALVIDECHHAASPSWMALINRIPARFRWGFTATPDRPDGLEVLLPLVIGPQVVIATSERLIADGALFRPRVVPVHSDHVAPSDAYPAVLECACGWTGEAWPKDVRDGIACPRGARVQRPCPRLLRDAHVLGRGRIDWTLAQDALERDAVRRKLVVDLAHAGVEADRRTLVLLPRIALAEQVCGDLRKLGVRAVLVTSDVHKTIRRNAVKAFRAGRVDVLVATQVADEGFDVADVDLAILGSAGRARGRSTQRVGRTARPTGKQPIVLDIVDAGDEYVAQWRARCAAYRKEFGAASVPSAEPVFAGKALALLRS